MDLRLVPLLERSQSGRYVKILFELPFLDGKKQDQVIRQRLPSMKTLCAEVARFMCITFSENHRLAMGGLDPKIVQLRKKQYSALLKVDIQVLHGLIIMLSIQASGAIDFLKECQSSEMQNLSCSEELIYSPGSSQCLSLVPRSPPELWDVSSNRRAYSVPSNSPPKKRNRSRKDLAMVSASRRREEKEKLLAILREKEDGLLSRSPVDNSMNLTFGDVVFNFQEVTSEGQPTFTTKRGTVLNRLNILRFEDLSISEQSQIDRFELPVEDFRGNQIQSLQVESSETFINHVQQEGAQITAYLELLNSPPKHVFAQSRDLPLDALNGQPTVEEVPPLEEPSDLENTSALDEPSALEKTSALEELLLDNAPAQNIPFNVYYDEDAEYVLPVGGRTTRQPLADLPPPGLQEKPVSEQNIPFNVYYDEEAEYVQPVGGRTTRQPLADLPPPGLQEQPVSDQNFPFHVFNDEEAEDFQLLADLPLPLGGHQELPAPGQNFNLHVNDDEVAEDVQPIRRRIVRQLFADLPHPQRGQQERPVPEMTRGATTFSDMPGPNWKTKKIFNNLLIPVSQENMKDSPFTLGEGDFINPDGPVDMTLVNDQLEEYPPLTLYKRTGKILGDPQSKCPDAGDTLPPFLSVWFKKRFPEWCKGHMPLPKSTTTPNNQPPPTDAIKALVDNKQVQEQPLLPLDPERPNLGISEKEISVQPVLAGESGMSSDLAGVTELSLSRSAAGIQRTLPSTASMSAERLATSGGPQTSFVTRMEISEEATSSHISGGHLVPAPSLLTITETEESSALADVTNPHQGSQSVPSEPEGLSGDQAPPEQDNIPSPAPGSQEIMPFPAPHAQEEPPARRLRRRCQPLILFEDTDSDEDFRPVRRLRRRRRAQKKEPDEQPGIEEDEVPALEVPSPDFPNELIELPPPELPNDAIGEEIHIQPNEPFVPPPDLQYEPGRDLLAFLREKAAEKKGRLLCFADICPPGSTSRAIAAEAFKDLIFLAQRNLVKIHQTESSGKAGLMYITVLDEE